jgi:ATP-binding cassette subfamily B protein
VKELLALRKYVAPHQWAILGGLLSLVAIDLLQLAVPYIMKRVVDDLAQAAATPQRLMAYSLWVVGVALAIGVGRFFWRYLIIGSARKIENRLRGDLFAHLTTLDFSYYDYHKTGDLMAHATNDINAVRMSLGFGLVILTDIVVLGLASLVMMFRISPRLTLLALIPLPVLSVVVTLFGQMIRRLFERVQKSFADMTELVRENVSGIRVVKLFVQEGAERERFCRASQDYLSKNLTLVRLWGMFFPLIMFIASLSQGIVFLAGGRMTVYGEVSVGDFVAFSSYLGILIWPMIAIGQAINIFQRGAASQGRINRIFETKPAIRDLPGVLPAPSGRHSGAIEFDGVTSYYNGKSAPALENLSFVVPPRQLVGITGSIGSGKSSLVSLLLRLYEPTAGRVMVSGHEIREYSLAALRSMISFVPQETFLFSDTIAENITFGRQEMPDQAELERVARLASIHDEIAALPRGYQTVIGERGVTLSGGQKQRLALARALLADKPILIMDDALSAVDADTERRILDALRSELKRRTAIVISHRIFAIQNADLILVLDQGKIVERGKHRELLARKGLYHQIYQLQQLERAIAKK